MARLTLPGPWAIIELVTNQFERFERLLERLIEGPFWRLFAGRLRPEVIVSHLARAVEDAAVGNQAPDRYWVYLNPEDWAEILETEPNLAALLADEVVKLVGQAGLRLTSAPQIDLLPRPDLPSGTMSVNAEATGLPRQETRPFERDSHHQRPHPEPDGSTYLIVEGQRHIPLTRTVYTLGRRLDCDIVLGDRRVSRRHAQLRWRLGRFVLFDLGSTQGVLVNGHRITEAVLEPGDVFSLGGAEIIYGRDQVGDSLNSGTGDQSTRTWKRHQTGHDEQ